MDSESEGERPVQAVRVKSRRPPNTAFRQQRLKAWQPILTPKTVLPLFFSVACIFALFGGLLIYASNSVQELELDYTECHNQLAIYQDMPAKFVKSTFSDAEIQGDIQMRKPQWRYVNATKSCGFLVTIPEQMGPPLYMFYKLTNFYQNHRRYVLSYSEDQLNGEAKKAKDLNSSDDCRPLITNEEGVPYYPCGLIANSFFNDKFSSLENRYKEQGLGDDYHMTNKGISWSSDKNRFKKTKYSPSDVVPPPNWKGMFPNGYNESNMPNLEEWEELQNWMRTAGLPTFSKLALRNDTAPLHKGYYNFSVEFNFNTTAYNGRKYIILSTRSVIGGRNPFLGVAYCVVAGICALLGVLFLAHHLIKPRRLGDHTYLSWNQERR